MLIEEIHGKQVRAGDYFGAAHVVGHFDSVDEMHQVDAATRASGQVSAAIAAIPG